MLRSLQRGLHTSAPLGPRAPAPSGPPLRDFVSAGLRDSLEEGSAHPQRLIPKRSPRPLDDRPAFGLQSNDSDSAARLRAALGSSKERIAVRERVLSAPPPVRLKGKAEKKGAFGRAVATEGKDKIKPGKEDKGATSKRAEVAKAASDRLAKGRGEEKRVVLATDKDKGRKLLEGVIGPGPLERIPQQAQPDEAGGETKAQPEDDTEVPTVDASRWSDDAEFVPPQQLSKEEKLELRDRWRAEKRRETWPPILYNHEAVLRKLARLIAKSRNSTTEALNLAHAHLTAMRDLEILAEPTEGEGEASTSTQGVNTADAPSRGELYATLRALFHRHRLGGAPSRSLLRRQIQEGVPLSPQAAQDALLGIRGPAPSLAELLPALPARMEPELLALVIHSLIDECAPQPAEVREAITKALSADHPEIKGREEWSWDLWAALLASHVPHDDFRGALRTLGEFRPVVIAAREAALGERQSDPVSDGGSSETSWLATTDPRLAILTSVYTTTIGLWVSSRFSDPRARGARLGSAAPRWLAEDFANLLSPSSSTAEGLKLLPASFLTAWLNAERVAGTGTAWSIWPLIAGQSVEATITGDRPPKTVPPYAWIALLKLLKTRPPETWRPIAGRVLGSNNTEAAVALLTAAAGSYDHMGPDLPLLLYVLERRAADHRALDVVGAGMVRAARRGGAGGILASVPFPHSTRDADGEHGIAPREWKWLGDVVAGLDVLENAGSDSEQLTFPLSRPRMQLGEPDAQSSELMVETHRATFTPETSKARLSDATVKLLAVLRRAIVAEAKATSRLRERRNEEEQTEQDVLDAAMARVLVDVERYSDPFPATKDRRERSTPLRRAAVAKGRETR